MPEMQPRCVEAATGCWSEACGGKGWAAALQCINAVSIYAQIGQNNALM